MRLPAAALFVLAAAVVPLTAFAADCPAVMSLSGPDANRVITITAHTEGACAGSRIDLDIIGMNAYPSFVKHCDEPGNLAAQCDNEWTFDTTCWPTGTYTARLTGHCSVLKANGECGEAGTPGTNEISFSIDSTPRVSVSFSPNQAGVGTVTVGYEFPNERGDEERHIETYLNGEFWRASPYFGPMSGTWSYETSTECWAPGEYTVTAKGFGCTMTGQSSVTNITVSPATTVSPSWSQDVLTVSYSFGNTGEGTLLKSRKLLLSVDGGAYQELAATLQPAGTAAFPLHFDCGTGTHRLKVKAVGCGSNAPEYVAEGAATAAADECPRQTRCKLPPQSVGDDYRPAAGPGVSAGAGCQLCVDKPVSVAGGDVSLTIPLFTLAAEPLPLSFALTYHSSPLENPVPFRLGPAWTHTFNSSITIVTPYRLQLFTPTGDRVFFDRVGDENRWVAGYPAAIQDEIVLDGGGYRLNFFGGGSATYAKFQETDTSARWTSTSDRWGNSITGSYDASNRLTTITDMVGRVVTLYYDDFSDAMRLTRVVLPDGNTWRFEYYGNYLRYIFDPLHIGTGAWRAFWYGPGPEPLPLTDVYDWSGAKLEHHYYDHAPDGHWRGTSSSTAADALSPGSRNTYFVEHDTPDPGKTRVRHVIGGGVEEVAVYTLTTVDHSVVPSRIDGVCSSCGMTTDSQVFAYDSAGRVTSRTDGAGHVTTYAYDAHGNVTSITEAAGTPRARTTTYEYLDPAWPSFVSRITQPSVAGAAAGRITENVWNADYTVLTTTVRGNLAPGQPAAYSTVTTYDSRHRVLSVDGPRTDVADTRSRALYPDADAAVNRRGRVMSATNAAGQLTAFDNYDVYGTPRTVVDSNSVSTTTVTDPRGRTTSATNRAVSGDVTEASDYTTSSTFDERDRLLETTSARGMKTRYVYDDGTNWLTDTVRLDAAGNEVERRHLTLNVAGMKVAEEGQACASPAAACSTWVTKRSESFVYDAKGRLAEVVHPLPAGARVAYAYDADGKLVSVKDENHTSPNTTYAYDELDRLTSVAQKLGAGTVVTRYDYDEQDNLVTVTDPNGNVTTYVYDDFQRMQRQLSPVTGETVYAYDPAGNLLSTHDANGATTTRTYDVLSRVTSATSSRAGASTETVLWTYDTGTYGMGRVASMTDPTGSTVYSYDRRGLLKSEAKTVAGTTYATSFTYDAGGNRTAMTYPSGRVVTYGYDFADRPFSASAGATPLVISASYLPFGPMASLTYGNGTTKTMSFDARYRPLENKLTGAGGAIADYLYANDAAGNITQIHDALDPSYNRDFGYDDLNRLVTANGGASLWGAGSYTYDAMGNMLTFALGTSRVGSFNYSGTTPKLAAATENGATRAVSYDATGNESIVGATPFAYSSRNFLESGEGLTYRYNGRGLRTITSYPASSLASLSVTPATLYLNQTATGTVTLGGPAPAGGVVVQLASSSPSVLVPSSITIPEGSTSSIFGITSTTNTAGTAVITASAGFTRTTSITLAAGPTLAGVSLDPSAVVAGATATGTVTLSAAAPPHGSAVSLSSNAPPASVPPSVTVVEGQTTATFDVATSAVNTSTSATITAQYGATHTATLTITPAVDLSSLSVTPGAVIGGATGTGTVTLSSSAPAGGITVTLSSSNALATVPASVTVPAGATTASFAIITSTTATSSDAVINGTFSSVSRSATLTINPCVVTTATQPTIPAGDEVWIDEALPAGASGSATWDTSQAAHGARSLVLGPVTGFLTNNVVSQTTTLTPVFGDRIVFYLLVDPCAPPRALKVHLWGTNVGWKSAWWGEPLLEGGSSGINKGAIPTGGSWQRIEIAASDLGLVDVPIAEVKFQAYDGRVWFDSLGKHGLDCTVPTATAPTIPAGDEVWIDDAAPIGGSGSVRWDTAQAAHGTKSIVLGRVSGFVSNNVVSQTTPLTPAWGDRIVFYLLVDPCTPPAAIKVHLWGTNVGWKAARWGATLLEGGTSGIDIGAIPTGGSWQRVEIPAADLGLVDIPITEVKLQIYDGRAWFDSFGKHGLDCTVPAATPPAIPATDQVWIDDALPAGMTGNIIWDTSQAAHASQAIVLGRVSGFLTNSAGNPTQPLTPSTGDRIVFYMLVDPCTPPRAVKVHLWGTNVGWKSMWWGEALLEGGSSGIAMGSLPTGGTWTRVEVPAADLGFVDVPITQVKFQIYDGRAWFDSLGTAPAPPLPPSMLSSYTEPTTVNVVRYSLYTPEMNLLAETAETTSSTPSIAYEYVWFAGQPIAQFAAGTSTPLYTFTDHLGTPLLQTDASGATAWRAEYEPYGTVFALRSGAALHQPLRFPGQEAEGERTYNIFRWYREGWGRYTQADPITYRPSAFSMETDPSQADQPFAYARLNPTRLVDPLGLLTGAEVRCILSYGLAGGIAGGVVGGGAAALASGGVLVVPGAGIGVAIGGIAGVDIGILVCTNVGTCALDRIREFARTRPWRCTAKCSLMTVPGGFGTGEYVWGPEAAGSSQRDACLAAKRLAANSTPPGFRAKHCDCKCNQ